MKKVIIIAIVALNVVSLSYLTMSESNQSFTITSAIAEQPGGDFNYDKYSDCTVTENGEEADGCEVSCDGETENICNSSLDCYVKTTSTCD